MLTACRYTKIRNNGYRFLYLTSRSISHAPLTREWLKGVNQESLALPTGPILCSPQNFLTSINREVIKRNPHEFKIKALQSIKSLFPLREGGVGPFHAGFGNRHTDVISYLAVDVPRDRVFTINTSGIVEIGTGAVPQPQPQPLAPASSLLWSAHLACASRAVAWWSHVGRGIVRANAVGWIVGGHSHLPRLYHQPHPLCLFLSLSLSLSLSLCFCLSVARSLSLSLNPSLLNDCCPLRRTAVQVAPPRVPAAQGGRLYSPPLILI